MVDVCQEMGPEEQACLLSLMGGLLNVTLRKVSNMQLQVANLCSLSQFVGEEQKVHLTV